MAIKLKITNGDYSIEVEAGKTVMVKCNGKKLAEDLVFEAVEVVLISFTVDGVSYQAEEGMTWGEWGGSKYDPSEHWSGGYFDGYYLCKSGSYVAETSVNVIVDGQAYVLRTLGGGGAD